MPQETIYTTDFQAPDFIVRGRDAVLEMPIRRDGALVAPSSGSVVVRDHNGDTVATGAAVITANIATYSLLGSVHASMEFSSRWREFWTLEVAGADFVVERPAALTRGQIFPVVSVERIQGRHADLARSYSGTETQAKIDDAWGDVMSHLLNNGTTPWRLLDSSDLRNAHSFRSWHLHFLDMWSSAAGGKFRGLAAHYDAKYEAEWNKMRLDIDTDDDGVADGEEEGRSGSPVLLTGGVSGWTRRRRSH